jgi:hypothetical protein
MPKSKTSTSSKNNRDTLPERFESYNDADYAAARLLNNACNVRPFILKDTGVTDYRIED